MEKIITLIFSITITLCIQAQNAEVRISELVNNGKWFELNEEFPKLKDSIKYEYVKDLAEGLLAHYFDSYENGCKKLSNAVRKHQSEYGLPTSMVFMQYVLTDYELNGEYNIAAQKAKSVVESTEEQNIPLDLSTFKDIYKRNSTLERYPSPEISRPNDDIEVAYVTQNPDFALFEENKPIDGLIYIPVRHHGKQYHFILDTGASMTYISSRFAQKAGIRKIEGYEYPNNYGNIGYIDSLEIGNGIVFKNIIAMIGKEGEHDSLFTADAVLGMDFIRRIEEVQFDTRSRHIIFPARRTATPTYGKNIYKDYYGLITMKVSDKLGSLAMGLDTGCPVSIMTYNFYQKNINDFISKGKKVNAINGGYLKNATESYMSVPSHEFCTCDTTVTFNDLLVSYTKNTTSQNEKDGNFGMEFINKFNKVTINTKEMFIKVE